MRKKKVQKKMTLKNVDMENKMNFSRFYIKLHDMYLLFQDQF